MSSKRARLLTQGQKALKKAMLPLKIRKDKNSLEKWILTKEEECGNLQIEIEEKKAAENLNADEVLDAIDALEEKQHRLKQGKDLMTELFEDEETDDRSQD